MIRNRITASMVREQLIARIEHLKKLEAELDASIHETRRLLFQHPDLVPALQKSASQEPIV